MILAVLDDLMFTSKIKTAAVRLGATVRFARSAASAVEAMHHETPHLVILDLDSAKTDPLGVVRAMKADAVLRRVPTVGFVSHVRTDLIESAQKEGVDEVLPRSAFTAGVGDILKRDVT